MKQPNMQNSQRGMALIAAVLIIAIFTIMGMMNAQKAKESEKIAAGNARYQVVFQTAETSLRNAVEYINKAGNLIDGYAGKNSQGRKDAENFDLTKVKAANIKYDPQNTVVWDSERLRETVCPSNTCKSGIDFMKKLDEGFWKDHAIHSKFTNDVSSKNYIKDTETYTIVEKLQTIDQANRNKVYNHKVGSGGSGSVEEFFLITVKASGYPPGTTNKVAVNSRENIIVQAVFAKRI